MKLERALISVVDDDASVREALPDLLKEMGYSSRSFPSAAAFLSSGYIGHTLPHLGRCNAGYDRTGTASRVDAPAAVCARDLHYGHSGRGIASPPDGGRGCGVSDQACQRAGTHRSASDGASRELARRKLIVSRRIPMNINALRTSSRSLPVQHATPIVFVVDDDPSVREALESMILQAGWLAKVFATAHEFLEQPRAMVPSCLVLDVTLPGLSGLELQSLIAGDRIDLPIIFITGHADVPMTVKAMKAGAVEFFTKPIPEEVLLGAIGVAVAQSRVTLEQESESRALRGHYTKLTPRERDVMGLVVRGLLNKQVGAELGMAEITVKAHRGQVMRKMNAASLADLVNMAARLGLEKPAQRRR
jgi:FixJ family two-component response regulator